MQNPHDLIAEKNAGMGIGFIVVNIILQLVQTLKMR